MFREDRGYLKGNLDKRADDGQHSPAVKLVNMSMGVICCDWGSSLNGLHLALDVRLSVKRGAGL